MNEPISILILGATGHIGGDLCRWLRDRHPQVTVVGTGRKVEAGSGLLAFDPFEDDWSKIAARYDVVVNCIGAIRESREMSFERLHLGLTRLILAHRELLGRPRIVQVSALGASPGHELSFLRSKGLADELLLSQPGVAVLRPSVVCHPGTLLQDRLAMLLDMARLSFGKLLVPKGFAETRVQPIFPDDLSALLTRLVLSRETGVVDAVGGEAFTFRELLEGMATATGRSINMIEVPREIMDGFVRYFVSVWFPDTLNYEQFRLLFVDHVGDRSQAERLLGRTLASTRSFWAAVPDGPGVLGETGGLPGLSFGSD